ncbi:60S ribosomal protein L31 [archaeon]|nr:60S ribosomal protein L31 [archaeon]
MADYIIPLRKEWLKVPIYKRTRYAVHSIRRFISKHLKVDDVRICKELNLKIWERGNRHPPHKIKVTAVIEEKDKEKYAIVNLFGSPLKLKEEKKEEKAGLIEKIKGVVEKKEKPEKEEEKKEKLEKEEEKKKTKSVVEQKEDLLKMQDRKKQPRQFKRERGKGELEMERETAIISKTYKKSS